MDIWLFSNCDAAFTCDSGMYSFSEINRKPIIQVEAIPIGYILTGKKDLFVLPKLIYDEKQKKYLSIKELIERNLINCCSKYIFDQNNLKVIDNDPEDLLNISIEFNNYYMKGLKLSDYDLKLQNQFWSVLSSWEIYSDYHGEIKGIISPSFLKKYEYLLY